MNRYKWYKHYKDNTRYIHTRIGNERKDVLLTTFIKRKFSKIKNNNFTKSNLTKKVTEQDGKNLKVMVLLSIKVLAGVKIATNGQPI